MIITKKRTLLPEKQIGKNTVGCLLDAELFIPAGGIHSLDYQY
jgi:hypothetical protein